MKEKLQIFKDEKLNFKTTISILFLTMVICGIWGFVYETFFYRIDLGYFVKRGSTFGPWIPIYAVGSFFIVTLTYRLKNKPVLVFVFNCLITGLLEYVTGMVLFEVWGLRLWDYNSEIWNWGNINGYVCTRSILCFGISSLLLVYVIVPAIIKLTKKVSERKFAIISYGLSGLFLLDIVLYAILKR